MARRSLRTSTGSAARVSSKRAKAADASPDGPSTKRTKTAAGKAGKATTLPTRSKYFESDLEDDDSKPQSEFEDEEKASSDYDDEEDAKPSSGDDDEVSDVSSEDAKPKKRGQVVKSTPSKTKGPNRGKELLKPGADTGLEPGTQIIIKKPKARGDGGIPYVDDAIHPNTMLFLEDLTKNNNREWLKSHDPDYRVSLKDFDTFLESLTEKITEIDETIPELPVKDIIFRIYRDVRFSNDKTPYKTHFSAAWSRTGRKGPYAAYYVQIKPNGGSFVGGGLWQPEPAALAALRRNVDQRPERLKSILKEARLRKEILGVSTEDEKKVVSAFIKHNEGSALKTKPKGYEADHKDIAILRLRSYTLGKRLADNEVIGPRGLARILDLVARLAPFITYLNSVVMPDPGHEDDDEDDEDDEEDEDEDDGEDSGSDDASGE